MALLLVSRKSKILNHVILNLKSEGLESWGLHTELGLGGLESLGGLVKAA